MAPIDRHIQRQTRGRSSGGRPLCGIVILEPRSSWLGTMATRWTSAPAFLICCHYLLTTSVAASTRLFDIFIRIRTLTPTAIHPRARGCLQLKIPFPKVACVVYKMQLLIHKACIMQWLRYDADCMIRILALALFSGIRPFIEHRIGGFFDNYTVILFKPFFYF